MADLLRDAPVGQLIRWATKNRVLQYPEEKTGFACPMGYQDEKPALSDISATNPPATDSVAEKLENLQTSGDQQSLRQSLRHMPTAIDVDQFGQAGGQQAAIARTLSRAVTRPEMTKIQTRADLEEAYTNATRQESMKNQESQAIMPEKTTDGITLVDWYDTNDQENPQNWSTVKKGVVVLQIYLYTLAVYMG
jgi:DHA1 family multidrug resistance protein-like MFS transporter